MVTIPFSQVCEEVLNKRQNRYKNNSNTRKIIVSKYYLHEDTVIYTYEKVII